MSLPKKGNMVRHIESCNLIAERKSQRENNKVCPYCDKVYEKRPRSSCNDGAFCWRFVRTLPLSFAIPDEQTNEEDSPYTSGWGHFVTNNLQSNDEVHASSAHQSEILQSMQDEYATEVQSIENPVTSNYFETSNESYMFLSPGVLQSTIMLNAGESLIWVLMIMFMIVLEILSCQVTLLTSYVRCTSRQKSIMKSTFVCVHHKNSDVEYLLDVFGDMLYDGCVCRKIKYRLYNLKSLSKTTGKINNSSLKIHSIPRFPKLCTISELTHRTVSLLLIVGQVEMKFGYRNWSINIDINI